MNQENKLKELYDYMVNKKNINRAYYSEYSNEIRIETGFMYSSPSKTYVVKYFNYSFCLYCNNYEFGRVSSMKSAAEIIRRLTC